MYIMFFWHLISTQCAASMFSAFTSSVLMCCACCPAYTYTISVISLCMTYCNCFKKIYNYSSAPSIYPNFSEFTTVIYFPDTHAKNCYNFLVMPNSTYMIKGSFFYGYYDNGTTLPSFQMAIDGTIVANVTIDDATKFVYYEFMVVAVSKVTFLCLLRDSSNSVPFGSAISFSFLSDNFFYSAVVDFLYCTQAKYFETRYMLNFGGDVLVRYVIISTSWKLCSFQRGWLALHIEIKL